MLDRGCTHVLKQMDDKDGAKKRKQDGTNRLVVYNVLYFTIQANQTGSLDMFA